MSNETQYSFRYDGNPCFFIKLEFLDKNDFGNKNEELPEKMKEIIHNKIKDIANILTKYNQNHTIEWDML